MLTVEYVRKKYPKEYGDLSDQEVQKVLDFFYTFGRIYIGRMQDSADKKQ